MQLKPTQLPIRLPTQVPMQLKLTQLPIHLPTQLPMQLKLTQLPIHLPTQLLMQLKQAPTWGGPPALLARMIQHSMRMRSVTMTPGGGCVRVWEVGAEGVWG